MSTRTKRNSDAGASRLVLLLLLLPFVLLVVTGFATLIWWQYFKTTPEYSVAILVDASQRNDNEAFDRVFDMNQVIQNFLIDGTRRATGSPELAEALGIKFKPASSVASELIQPVVREGVQARIKELGASTDRMPFFVKAIAIRTNSSAANEDRKARVTIRKGSQDLEMWLVPESDHWKVIAIKNDALAAEILAEVTRELKNHAPDQLQKRMTDALPEVQKLLP
jgi:hypothetical protein